MSAKPRATLTLGLAVASLAAPAATLAAEPAQEMGWTCNMNRNGEWQCDVSDEPVTAAEPPATTAPQTADTQTATTETRSAGSAVTQTSEPVPTTTAPAATAVNTAPVVRADTSPSPAEPFIPAPVRVQPVTARPVTPVAQATPQGGEWQCSAGENGEWDCNNSGPNTRTAIAQQSHAGHTGTEWDCADDGSGEWNCNQIASAAMPATPMTAMAVAVRTANRWSHLDWVAAPAGSGQCRGYYQQPVFETLPADDDTPLLLEAARSSTQLGGLSRLEGGVNLRHGQRMLSANYAEFDQVTNKATLRGGVKLREPGLLLLGDTARADITTRETLFTDAQYVFHEQRLRGSADKVLHLQDGRLRLEQSSYTYCPPGDETWLLAADNIMLDKEQGYGEASDAVLRIGGVPVFYAPWFTFPIDDRRRSGFLYPSFSAGSDNGVELATPYYFNLAENYDDTFTPHLITKRGLLLENEFRYLNNYSYSVLSTSYMVDDDLRGDSRWLLGLDSELSDKGRWRGEIDYTRVSDTEYFSDLDTNLEVRRQDHLDQRGEVIYQGDSFYALARVHSYQTLGDDLSPYRRVPQLWVQGGQSWDALRLNYQAEYVRFDRDLDGVTGADRVTGDRVHLMPGIRYNYRQPWGYVVPEARLWSNTYSLENQLAGVDDSPSVTVPVLSLDSGLYFDRLMANGGTHTLEPRLFALYVKEEDQDAIPDFDTSLLDFNYNSLFRFNRFAGRDRIGDTQQISLGLTSRWILEDGSEQARFSIGQAYYLADRNVQLDGASAETDSSSDIATESVWHFNRNWRATLDMIFDDQADVSESNLKLRYQQGLDRRFNLSYRFEDEVRKQVDSSFIWPLGDSWSVMGRWQQDIQNSETLESLLGVEYESCCWRVRVAARQWLDDTDNTDSAIFLQFFLKGLGGIGSGGGSYLNDIIGYQEREEQKR